MNKYIQIIEKYLAISRCIDGEAESADHFVYFFTSGALKYGIVIDSSSHAFSISMDHEAPFSCNSLFEQQFTWDSVSIEQEVAYYGNTDILCLYGQGEEGNCVVLKIIKWPNGKISIWPENLPTNKEPQAAGIGTPNRI